MSTDRTAVTVATNTRPEGVTYRYADLRDARSQARAWVALGIRMARTGTHWTDVEHIGRRWKVRGHDDRNVLVAEIDPAGRRRVWSSVDVRAAAEALYPRPSR
jgi:hypothetical protein